MQLPTTPAGVGGEQLPPHRLYRHVFRHMMLLERMAEEAEARGEDGSKYRNVYKSAAGLTDAQAAVLAQIARESDAEVNQIDDRAKQQINAARALVPNGVLQAGQTPPPPPESLKNMQVERDQALLNSVDRLRGAFGAEEFARFDDYVKQNMGPAVKTVGSMRPPPPAGERRQPLMPSLQSNSNEPLKAPPERP
ncbi:MAG: hypothetical protein ACRD4L_12865 [Pyrinomonadaceae bacterium]